MASDNFLAQRHCRLVLCRESCRQRPALGFYVRYVKLFVLYMLLG